MTYVRACRDIFSPGNKFYFDELTLIKKITLNNSNRLTSRFRLDDFLVEYNGSCGK